ncbi:MAG TPA: flagellar assembly protein FliX [Kiloniellales bacterium]|nr:flagellar assembly protein FliX [Kiloniellales bacterium]
MKIDRVSSVASAPARRGERAGSAKDGGFARALGSGLPGEAASGVAGARAPSPLDALLSVQEVSNEFLSRRQAKRRAEDLLDELDALKIALLEGRLPLAALERLAERLERDRGRVEDPRLAEVLAEIELRAAVELAKLGR